MTIYGRGMSGVPLAAVARGVTRVPIHSLRSWDIWPVSRSPHPFWDALRKPACVSHSAGMSEAPLALRYKAKPAGKETAASATTALPIAVLP